MKRSMTVDANVTRQQIADAFRAAKRRLWKGRGSSFGKETYICYALSTTDAGLAAQRIIMQRLGKRGQYVSSVDTWLRRCGFVSGFGMPNYDRLVQSYRHRWLDALIKEFSS